MNSYDKVLLALYAISLLAIIILVGDLWALAILFILILIIGLLQKVSFEEELRHEKIIRKKSFFKIAENLDIFSDKIDTVKHDIDKNFFTLENRIIETRSDYQKDIDMNYRELVRKILEIENRLNSTKKTFSAAFGAVDERLNHMEKDDED